MGITRLALGAACVLWTLAACQRAPAPESPEQDESASAAALAEGSEEAPPGPPPVTWLPGEDESRAAQASAARSALANALSERLMSAIQEGGAAAALHVCAEEAQDLSAQIAEAHGVRIGRTSFRVRNDENAPPGWARPLVARGEEQPQRLLSSDGVYAELTPIRTSPPCLLCHGAPSELGPGVSQLLAQHYPNDQAVGFAEGELRGWFWVEVDESAAADANAPGSLEP